MATAYATRGSRAPDTSGLTKRQYLDSLHSTLWSERSALLSKWLQIGQQVWPDRVQWCVTSTQTAPAFGAILDNEAGQSLRTLSAGLMSKLSSPAVPWFALTTTRAELDQQSDVKRWLADVRDVLLSIMERSNFYTEAETIYAECGLFATAAMAIQADPETVVRYEAHPIGSYAIAHDSRRRVNTWVREWSATAAQMAQQFGYENLSLSAQMAINNRTEQQRFTVKHAIYPNAAWDPRYSERDSSRKQFAECYWEVGSEYQDRFLGEGGYDSFPLAVPRWGPLAPGNVYGTSAPGWMTLGDVMMLQEMERQTLNGYRKVVSPPTVSGTDFRNKTIYSIPGANNVADGGQGDPTLRAMYEVRIPFDQIEAKMEQVRRRIRSGYYADIMAPILMDERQQRATAAEIYQTRDEQYGLLGPTVTRQSDDFHTPVIDRTFALAWKAGEIPVPPESMQGAPLRVQLISPMAQAQKSIGVVALERHMLFVGQMAGLYGAPALDNTDADEVIREHATATGVPPKGVRSPEETAQIRTQRMQAQAAAQAAQAAPGIADAAKKLSETKLNQDSALDALAAAGAGG